MSGGQPSPLLAAPGGREVLVAASLAAAGLPVVVNPRQVRAFAGAIGQLAKPDAFDAALLAHFAAAVRPLPGAAAQALAALVARDRQLVAMLTAERQRPGPALPVIRAQVARHLAWLRAKVATLDHELARTAARTRARVASEMPSVESRLFSAREQRTARCANDAGGRGHWRSR